MKKINELKQKRAGIITQMQAITANETLTPELREQWNGFDTEIRSIDDEIALLERQEALNAANAKPIKPEDNTSVSTEFRDWLRNAVENNGSNKFELRAEPIVTTTNSDIINKTVADSVDILTSPGEAFLKTLGITMYPNLVGNFTVPSMAEHTAGFVNETSTGGNANMAHEDLTLAARRVTSKQTITRETLAQTNPAIYASIVQNLYNGIWNAVTNDVFDQIDTDAATRITSTGTTATYQNILNLEASIGGLSIGSGAYVTTPTGKAFFKGLDVGSDGIKYAWNGNDMNGYPAYGVPAANSNKVYFGDFSKVAVGQWGGIEIIVDPYTQAADGEIVLTAVGLFDSGVINTRGLAILNASLG